MKFTSILAVFALLQVSEARDISCVRTSTGVDCSEQSSLFNIMRDETALAYYSYDQQVAMLTSTQNWFTTIDTNRNGLGTWAEYYNWIVVQTSYYNATPTQQAAQMTNYINSYNAMSQGKGYFTRADVRRYTLQIYPGPITQ